MEKAVVFAVEYRQQHRIICTIARYSVLWSRTRKNCGQRLPQGQNGRPVYEDRLIGGSEQHGPFFCASSQLLICRLRLLLLMKGHTTRRASPLAFTKSSASPFPKIASALLSSISRLLNGLVHLVPLPRMALPMLGTASSRPSACVPRELGLSNTDCGSVNPSPRYHWQPVQDLVWCRVVKSRL